MATPNRSSRKESFVCLSQFPVASRGTATSTVDSTESELTPLPKISSYEQSYKNIWKIEPFVLYLCRITEDAVTQSVLKMVACFPI